jgi:hypothetical protein
MEWGKIAGMSRLALGWLRLASRRSGSRRGIGSKTGVASVCPRRCNSQQDRRGRRKKKMTQGQHSAASSTDETRNGEAEYESACG